MPHHPSFKFDMDAISPTSAIKFDGDGRLEFSTPEGATWKTSGPILILHYYDRQHPRAQSVEVPSSGGNHFGTAGTPSLSAQVSWTVEPFEGGQRVVVDSPNIGIQLSLSLTVDTDGWGIRARIEGKELREDMPHLYRIVGLEILPEFGAAVTGENGYLTLPNWAGCQTFFNKSYPREVRQTIYSSNDQWENNCNAPVFGITREHGTVCGLITAGDYDAELVCRVHWEAGQTNSVHPTLIYRWQQQDELISGLREVRYRFSPSQPACGEGYVFCATTYRDFLHAERGVLTWEKKGETRPEALDYRDRFFLKIFMAYKDPQADGKGPYHSACTFSEVRGILEDLNHRGVKRLAAILVGWGQDGHDGMPPTRFPVDERLGGEKAFRELIVWCREQDIMIGVHDSYGGYYSCSPEFNTDDLVRHRTGEYWESIIWSGGQSHLACPKVYVDKQVKRDVTLVSDLGIHGHHHVDAVGSFMTCHSKDHPLEARGEFIAEVRKMFEFILAKIGSLSTEYPFGPYLDVMDGYFHSYTKPSPWHRASRLGRFFLDRAVPMIPIAISGSLVCGESIGEVDEGPMYWLSWGLTPNWEVTARASTDFGIPAYSAAVDRLVKIYTIYFGEESPLLRLRALEITGREEWADGLVKLTYSDETRILVNPTDQEVNGLAAQSYQIQG